MANNTSDRGFAKMKDEEPERQRDIASKGGNESPTKFGSKKGANPHKAGQAGAAAQPTEAKREGGRH